MRKIEGLCLSSIEDELSFKEWCNRNGVNLFLFDGDDTIWATVEIFRHHLNRCYDFLTSACPALSHVVWKENIERINDACFEQVGVSPTRWDMVINQLAEEQDLDQGIVNDVLGILMKIYETLPRFLEGAQEGLSFIKRTGMECGIVTHADSAWTRRKYKWLNLDRFFSWDDIYCVDPNGHKTAKSWAKAIAYFGRTPGQCAVVGDSPRTDIKPSGEIGVLHRFCVDSPTRWVLHNQEVDDEVWKIRGINDLRWLGHQLIKSGTNLTSCI